MVVTTLSNQHNHQNISNRLFYLDGLRGIAILLVVLYHAYADWGLYMPYHLQYAGTLFFQYGHYGVQLFFMISGFVIALTLENCNGLGEFIYRRWLRLFPAMFIATLLIVLTAPLLSARPHLLILKDALPGLLFIDPDLINALFNFKVNSLEIPFWTLYIEFKFYALAGLLYFAFGIKKMILVIVFMFFCSVVFELIYQLLSQGLASQILSVLKFAETRQLGWFATGALFYRYFRHKNAWNLCAAVIVGLFAARSLDGIKSPAMVFASIMVMVLAMAIHNKRTQKILGNQYLVWLGFISYPLYLIHDSALVSLIVQLHDADAWVPMYLLPILPILVVMLIAWLIAQYLEPNLRMLIKCLFKNKPSHSSSTLQ
jgi:peptidoglycan/LPS O-acetylase OafA/YrhL